MKQTCKKFWTFLGYKISQCYSKCQRGKEQRKEKSGEKGKKEEKMTIDDMFGEDLE